LVVRNFGVQLERARVGPGKTEIELLYFAVVADSSSLDDEIVGDAVVLGRSSDRYEDKE
jgi:hypothetical protein